MEERTEHWMHGPVNSQTLGFIPYCDSALPCHGVRLGKRCKDDTRFSQFQYIMSIECCVLSFLWVCSHGSGPRVWRFQCLLGGTEPLLLKCGPMVIPIIHALYGLFRMGVRPDSNCPRCARDHGDLIYLLWRCPKLYLFWTGVWPPSTECIRLPYPLTQNCAYLGS